ncbi:MAG TPA: acyl-CoA desaturase [Chryseolinea sp.]
MNIVRICVVVLVMGSITLKYSFKGGNGTFYKLLKEKVDDYFTESKLHPAGNRKLYVKSALQILSATILYVVLVFFTPIAPVALLLCLALGVNLALIGFNVMHEGGHQAFSSNARMNNISAYFLNVLGGITYYWKIKHNINHHTYTNVEGMDSDIDVKPFMRLHADQPLHGYHRFQHIYWVVLYGVSYLAWIFYEDFVKYFSGKVSLHGDKKPLAMREHVVFWVTKVIYLGVYVFIPIVMVGWLWWLLGFLVITITCGLLISVVFQLAHVVGGTQFHTAKADRSDATQEWAIHQVESTSNFGTSSKSLHWLLGGLNFQIEHHLFPRVSHIHYPAISRLVRDACREAGIVYNEHTSLWKALVSHLHHLWRLGRA